MRRKNIRLAAEKRKFGVHGKLYKSAEEKRANIKETLGVYTFFRRYLRCLLGLEEPNEQANIGTYEEQNAALQKQIDELLDEQQLLKQDYENAKEQIPQLDKEIAELLDKLKEVRSEPQKIMQKIKRTKTLRERLAILTKEFADENIDIEEMIEELGNDGNIK